MSGCQRKRVTEPEVFHINGLSTEILHARPANVADTFQYRTNNDVSNLPTGFINRSPK